MQKRLISGFIGLLLFVAVLIVKGPIQRIAFIIVSFVAMLELKLAIGAPKKMDLILSMITLSFIFYILPDMVMGAIILYYLMSVLLSILHKDVSVDRFLGNTFAFTYVALGFFLIQRAISAPISTPNYALIFTVAWGSDTAAYFVGQYFGTKKLAPRISPNKTVEGALGGILGSVLVSFIIYLLLLRNGGLTMVGVLAFSVIGAIIAELGDLAASKLKRDFNIKDYGFILPGHGGIMDRFDSVIPVAALYYLMYLLM
ncbi:phosphatidate cytidylyltransferase [Guggenheimella bovis]